MISPRPPAWLLGLLGAMGLVLVATTLPGTFLIDECHYLVTATGLCQGRLTLPGTLGLSPNQELFFFDPVARGRLSFATPAGSTAPGLYAVFALPFMPLGWRGLAALNTLSFLLCAALVYAYTARLARRPHTPVLASLTFLFSTYCLEYAQGVWPHMLSMLLCMAGLFAASRARDEERLLWPALSGLLAGLAVGVRYQNLVLGGGLGLGILLFAQHRIRAAGTFGLGLAGPLGALSIINRVRNGWWNPVSKGPYYLASLARQGRALRPWQPFWVLWAKVVDFVAHPPVQFMTRSPGSGAYLLHQTLKKAWLQSCPWLAVCFAALALAWTGRFRALLHDRSRRELRAIGLLVLPVLSLFAFAGFDRTDGFCFNQRYFIDLLPMMAAALALAVEPLPLRRWPLCVGILLGLNLVILLFTLDFREPVRHQGLLYLPLLIGLLLAVAYLRGTRSPGPQIVALLLGIALCWSGVVHVADDLQGSRRVRERKGWVAEQVREVLRPGEPSALFAHFPLVINLCPLALEHDLVIADTNLDSGTGAPRLTDELLARGRQVYVVMDRFFPAEVKDRLFKGRRHRTALHRGNLIVEQILP